MNFLLATEGKIPAKVPLEAAYQGTLGFMEVYQTI